ncbi:MAG TPA: iron-sulfur cluster assembly accessory protein [Gammaproteobacteria bacterium]|nr:iron-sulfur cluster assembly accessory protein [Gammaproteobacteria bacterium]
MEPIMNFTHEAVEYIKAMMFSLQGRGFRIAIKKTGCSGYSYQPTIVSQGEANDIHFTVEDLNVYLDAQGVELLKGVTVDFIEEKKEGTLKQKKLVFINPKEKSRCGCGESFHV